MGFRDFVKDKVGEVTKNAQGSSLSNVPSKRGLCWPVENKDPVFNFTKPGSKITWIYNWSPNTTAGCTSLDFVPMQWNNVGIDDLPTKIKDVNAHSVLYFNEPELPDQSNMSVELAANEWLRCIEPLRKQGIRCGSPGLSNAGHAVGYMQDFLCRIRAGGSDVDFLCLHWYGIALGGFYDYIWSTKHQIDASKPVWITEFACTNWNQDAPLPREHVEHFARESVKYLDTLDWVERYAWFGPMRDTGTVGKWARMLDDEGKLTPLGKAYRDE
ncbi:Alkali-sensitive linkage protein 1 [Fulvia fulva]|uniref:Alkali-sensitive linkage protein 1 n=1 Tax=Passalora fulva TaxID=5499 RepID=A0A9Q8L8X9_PASFU|nr:Alkali-sensitive linkage protein 1 [Fulvia fulva]KAK4636030.1 Alkali-sensitive linkage protein 1 [Fulvia fulva]KAK4638091.1 Alkali-sensitive linkage protein 1 [Fulvia fulva]UJO13038.1 Alkali-sensitive linkage protein 1 [Fulvia fulva]WPV10161.1 Alkali-sensitive linkage protein 1 [Fulvia fulva]WPV25313.1 Alkali-sensitive linkage protein 1 [Fulvia fulva]